MTHLSRLKTIATLTLLLLCCRPAVADRYKDYIEKYAQLAIDQQALHGIPASITLAQGLLESAAGRSTLATEGNNHFGIKCHRDWQGDTMIRSDDTPDDCFRVYESAEQSYADHSRFLLGRRYAPLFLLDITDYTGWARGLKACGYATDPNYAARLIAIIERYALYTYDTSGLDAEATALFIFEHLSQTHPVRKTRELHYVIANPGDTYASLAAEFHIDAAELAANNDSSNPNEEIRPWEEVYLEPKLDTAPGNVRTATIGQDETLHSVAQRYGVKESAIRALNPKSKFRTGARLKMP